MQNVPFKRFVALLIFLVEVSAPAHAAAMQFDRGLPPAGSLQERTPSERSQAEPLIQEAQVGVRARARPARVRPVARPARVRPVQARPARGVVVRRPIVAVVRPWGHRPHYGRVIAGVVLGSIITAAVIGSAPAQPAPNVCWYWLNSWQTEGYWDYCQ
jgi:hypothetical protein